MNVYDFDKTIFYPDSSACFVLYCLRHHPRQVLGAFIPSLLQAVKYARSGRKDAKKLKEALFSFLNKIEDVEETVACFWDEYFCRISPWYLEQKKEDDLIISASPEFLLKPAADRLGVSLIATRMNPYTGKISGRNCHGFEKCRRFSELYNTDKIDEFYSDALSDTPMAKLAEKAFLVDHMERSAWPE